MFANNDDKANAEQRIAVLRTEYFDLQKKNNAILKPALQTGFFDNLTEAEKHQKREKLSAELGTIPDRMKAIEKEIEQLEKDHNIVSRFRSPSAVRAASTPPNSRR
jgi:hypothetical protein